MSDSSPRSSIRAVLFGPEAPVDRAPEILPELGPVVLYAVAIGALSLLMPIAVQTLVNTVAFGTLLQPLVVLSLALLLALGLSSVFSALSTWAVETLERRFFLRWYLVVANRLSRLARTPENRDELINRFLEIYAAQKSVRSALLGGLESALTITVGLIVLSLYHPVLAAFAVLLTIVLAAALLGWWRAGFALARAESRAKYHLLSWIEELTIGHRLVAGSSGLLERADDRAKDYLQARAQRFRTVFRQRLALWGLQAVAMASLLGAGGWLVMQGQLTLGQLVAAELIVSGIGLSIAKLGGYVDVIYDLGASCTKLEHLRAGLTTAPGVDAGTTLAHKPWSVRLRSRDSERHVEPGELLVVTGSERRQESLVEALLLEANQCGLEVAYDGVSLADLDHRTVRHRIAYVGTGTAFSGTVLQNVTAGCQHIDRARARATLEQVGLSGELDAWMDRAGRPFPHSDLTRIAVARAALSDASIAVVDRALDTLDPEEATQLLRVLRGMTCIVVTQRAELAMRLGAPFVLRDDGQALEAQS